jgi:hypothetical protein
MKQICLTYTHTHTHTHTAGAGAEQDETDNDMPHWGAVRFRAETPEPRELPGLQMIDEDDDFPSRQKTKQNAENKSAPTAQDGGKGTEQLRAPPRLNSTASSAHSGPEKGGESVGAPARRKLTKDENQVSHVSGLQEVCLFLFTVYICIYIHICMYVCVCVYIYIYAYIYIICTYTHSLLLSVASRNLSENQAVHISRLQEVCLFLFTVYICIYIYIYIYVCMYVCMYVCIYMYVCVYIRVAGGVLVFVSSVCVCVCVCILHILCNIYMCVCVCMCAQTQLKRKALRHVQS